MSSCSHVVVATDSTKSTILHPRWQLLTLAYGITPNILTDDWLLHSHSNGSFLPADNFHIPSLQATIQNGIAARSNGNKGILGGYKVILCSGVASKDDNPPREFLRQLVLSAGGKWITDAQLGTALKAETSLSKYVIITSDSAKLTDHSIKALNLMTLEIRCQSLLKAVQSQEIEPYFSGGPKMNTAASYSTAEDGRERDERACVAEEEASSNQAAKIRTGATGKYMMLLFYLHN